MKITNVNCPTCGGTKQEGCCFTCEGTGRVNIEVDESFKVTKIYLIDANGNETGTEIEVNNSED